MDGSSRSILAALIDANLELRQRMERGEISEAQRAQQLGDLYMMYTSTAAGAGPGGGL